MKTLLLITHLAITPLDTIPVPQADTVQVVQQVPCETQLKKEKKLRKTQGLMLVIFNIITVAAICIPRKF